MKKFFSETAYYTENHPTDKAKAKEYLILWQEFFLIKILDQCDSFTILGNEWYDRPAFKCEDFLNKRSYLSYKICIDALNYQDRYDGNDIEKMYDIKFKE